MARKRIFPVGSTATDRVRVSDANLVRLGGVRKAFRLQPPATSALKWLIRQPGAPKTETELINDLLLAEKARIAAGRFERVSAEGVLQSIKLVAPKAAASTKRAAPAAKKKPASRSSATKDGPAKKTVEGKKPKPRVKAK